MLLAAAVFTAADDYVKLLLLKKGFRAEHILHENFY